MKVLRIAVDDALVDKWKEWLAPRVQLFFVDEPSEWPGCAPGELTPELQDTFRVWRPAFRRKKALWLDEATFDALPPSRRTELERTRAVVWPSQVSDKVVRAFVETEGLPNRRAHDLVGFAGGSGPNCFGAVMGAAGVVGAENEWMQLAPFTEWLHAHCRRGGTDDEPGTVLLWRDVATGDPFHAALTLGGGWAFEKSAQYWWAPRYVTSVAEIKRVTRMRGIRLERWRLAR